MEPPGPVCVWESKFGDKFTSHLGVINKQKTLDIHLDRTNPIKPHPHGQTVTPGPKGHERVGAGQGWGNSLCLVAKAQNAPYPFVYCSKSWPWTSQFIVVLPHAKTHTNRLGGVLCATDRTNRAKSLYWWCLIFFMSITSGLDKWNFVRKSEIAMFFSGNHCLGPPVRISQFN